MSQHCKHTVKVARMYIERYHRDTQSNERIICCELHEFDKVELGQGTGVTSPTRHS